jgi:WD40 repeat protein
MRMNTNRIAAWLVALFFIQAACTGCSAVPSAYTAPAPAGAYARIGKGIITSIALDSSGKLLAVGSYAGVFVYRTDTSAELWSAAAAGIVNDLAWSADRTVLAAGLQDGTIVQWDGKTGAELMRLSENAGSLNAVAWSPDGNRLAIGGSSGQVGIWDKQTGKNEQTAKFFEAVIDIAWSPTKDLLAVSTRDGGIEIMDAITGKQLHHLIGVNETYLGDIPWTGQVFVSWSPDGRLLASVDTAGIAFIWDAESGAKLSTLDSVYTNPAWSPDGETLAAGSGSLIEFWNVHTGKTGAPIQVPGENESVDKIAWSTGGKTLVSVSHQNAIAIWDVQAQTQPHIFNGFQDRVTSVSWSPDGSSLASGSWDGTIIIWNVKTRTHRQIIKAPRFIENIAWSPKGDTLAAATDFDQIILWAASTGKQVGVLPANGDKIKITWSPDGNMLASIAWDEYDIPIWQASTGELKYTFKGQDSTSLSIAWSPNGQAFASGSHGKVIVWDVQTAEPLHTLDTGQRIWNLAWFSNGNTLALMLDDGQIIRWNPESGLKTPLASWKGLNVWCMVLSPDDATLAIGTDTGIIELLDVHSGILLKTLTGHTGAVSSLAWSPDGKLLASGGYDGTTLVWQPGSR